MLMFQIRLFEKIKDSAFELPVEEKLKLFPSVQNPKVRIKT